MYLLAHAPFSIPLFSNSTLITMGCLYPWKMHTLTDYCQIDKLKKSISGIYIMSIDTKKPEGISPSGFSFLIITRAVPRDGPCFI